MGDRDAPINAHRLIVDGIDVIVDVVTSASLGGLDVMVAGRTLSWD